MSFADRLRIARREMGYSQEQMAEELKISRQSVTKWENGLTYPELKTLVLLAAILKKTLDWLLYDERSNLDQELLQDQEAECSRKMINSRKMMNNAMKNDLILEMVKTLEGYELRETLDTESFSGTRTYSFYDGRGFKELKGISKKTGEEEEEFLEMTLDELETLLIGPDRRLRRIQI